MAYGNFKYLTRRTASDKILRDKDLILLKIPNMMDINVELLHWLMVFLIKILHVEQLKMKIFLITKLPEELRKIITRKFDKRKVHSPFKDNTWVADLVDMQLISKFNKWFMFLFSAIDIYSKYAWVIPLED